MFWVSKIPCGCGGQAYYEFAGESYFARTISPITKYLCLRCGAHKLSISKSRSFLPYGLGIFKCRRKCGGVVIVYSLCKKLYFSACWGVCNNCKKHDYGKDFIPAKKHTCKFIQALSH